MQKRGIELDTINKTWKKEHPLPSFFTQTPNFQEIERYAKKYKKKKYIIICGRGGSVSAFRAIYHALPHTKQAYIVDTIDPKYLESIKKCCPIKETLLIVISKSGTTVDVLENYFYFHKYEKLIITEEKSALSEIAKKEKEEQIAHPPVSGRFSAGTLVCLLPLAIAGIHIRKVWEGMRDLKQSEAFKLAVSLYKLEKRRYTEVYTPLYAYELKECKEFIEQLMHETVCKKGKGQTFVCYEAPECHHHTHQRFFGGRKNMVGLFVRVRAWKEKERIHIPTQVENIQLRNGTVKILNNENLGKVLNYEYIGTKMQADKQHIPNFTVTLTQINEHEVGQLISFFELVAYYSACLRKVDPLTQPDVELSKELSFAMRKHEL